MRYPRLRTVGATVAVLWLLAPALGGAQTAAPDSSAGESGGSLLTQAQSAAQELPPATADTTVTLPGLGYLLTMTHKPKFGTKADVRQNGLYGELESNATLMQGGSIRNKAEWSLDEYRSQNKTVEKRKSNFAYGFGKMLPLTVTIDGRWDWSEDETVNAAGTANLFKMETKRVGITATKTKFERFGLTNSLRMEGTFDDQASINLGQQNDFQEGTLKGGVQSGYQVAEGIMLAGRVHGTTTSGDRLLGTSKSPSSAQGDSVGVGIYFEKPLGTGRIALTRSSFEKRYLEFRRNANGLIDTVGVDEQDKVVNELETRDALALDFESQLRVGRFGLNAKATRMASDLDYAASGVGLKERSRDQLDASVTFAAGRDSFAVAYKFGWTWDDQRIKGATENRGRQYNRERDLKFNWYRTLFDDTQLNLQYHQGLVQDIAEFQHNQNDKDRLSSDFSSRLERDWLGRFRASATFAYRRNEDVSIRASRSSNNNVKESYEVTPSYGWTVSDKVSVDQNYRLYIQYTNYVYSGLPSVTRDDDYNKRGNLTTKVTIHPTDRLTVIVRHDYNKRFNATKTGQDAAGGSVYSRDQNQTISTVDLDVKFDLVKGVSLQAGTYRTRDDRTSFGTSTTEKRTDAGEIVVGAKVDRTWGRTRPLQLSALVKKFNAFGPSITPTSADYWEADVWLKWQF